VPTDISLDGDSKTFTAKLTYDTLEMYGKVEAECAITVAK
jgi:hypothetical protein